MAKTAEGLSVHTLDDYRHSLGLLCKRYATSSISDMTTDDLRAFLAWLRETRSNKTIKNIHTVLGSFWSWLQREFGIPHIVRAIPAPKVNPPAWVLPTKDDIEKMLKACEYSNEANTVLRRKFKMRRASALRDKCILLVLVDSGVRVNELCSLTLADLNLEGGRILVRYGKGQKQRIVFVGKATRRLLWRYLTVHRKGERHDAPLFVGNNGRRMSRDTVCHLIERVGKRAGIRVWPHLLRHLFATEFLQGGGNIFVLKQLLGHTSNEMVERYAQIAEADLQRVHALASPADRWTVVAHTLTAGSAL